MNFSVGPITLVSRDKSRMVDFLSDVFEFEVNSELNTVHSGLFTLKIEYSEERSIDSQIKFHFKCRDLLHLKEIIQKFEFFRYRKEIENGELVFEKMVDIKLDETHLCGELSIIDIDGRTWNFKAETIH
jgi:hypothetical protein